MNLGLPPRLRRQAAKVENQRGSRTYGESRRGLVLALALRAQDLANESHLDLTLGYSIFLRRPARERTPAQPFVEGILKNQDSGISVALMEPSLTLP